MMRRSPLFRLVGTRALLTGSKVPAVADSLSTSEGRDKDSVPKEYPNVIIDPPKSFRPSASEAPELLQPYVEPKPFINPRGMQVFAVSMGVGAVTVGVIYFLLSKSISETVEDEQAQLDKLHEQNDEAAKDHNKILPDFLAPSNYNELQEVMRQHDKEMDRQVDLIKQQTSVLHTETLYRLKLWWNRSLSNIQGAIERFTKAQDVRKENMAKASVEAALRYNGYTLVELVEQKQ